MTSIPGPIAAFLAGILSFLSPCVLPLVPGYVSLISGTTVEDLQEQQRGLLRRVMLSSVMFILGFSAVFIALGAVATKVGQLTNQYRPILTFVASIVIVVFGLHLTGIIKIKTLYADKRLHSLKGGSTPWGAFVIGFAFAFGWAPCIGPILGAIYTVAAQQDTIVKGMALLAVYSLGLAVPFLLTSLGINKFLRFYGRFKRHLHTVELVSGVFLIVIGAFLLYYGNLGYFSSKLAFMNDWITGIETKVFRP